MSKLSNKTALRVIDALASHLSVNPKALRSPSRTEPLALKRAKVMYTLRDLGLSFAEIGELLDRDHTTVMAACRRIQRNFATHVGFEYDVAASLNIARSIINEDALLSTLPRATPSGVSPLDALNKIRDELSKITRDTDRLSSALASVIRSIEGGAE